MEDRHADNNYSGDGATDAKSVLERIFQGSVPPSRHVSAAPAAHETLLQRHIGVFQKYAASSQPCKSLQQEFDRLFRDVRARLQYMRVYAVAVRHRSRRFCELIGDLQFKITQNREGGGGGEAHSAESSARGLSGVSKLRQQVLIEERDKRYKQELAAAKKDYSSLRGPADKIDFEVKKARVMYAELLQLRVSKLYATLGTAQDGMHVRLALQALLKAGLPPNSILGRWPSIKLASVRSERGRQQLVWISRFNLTYAQLEMELRHLKDDMTSRRQSACRSAETSLLALVNTHPIARRDELKRIYLLGTGSMCWDPAAPSEPQHDAQEHVDVANMSPDEFHYHVRRKYGTLVAAWCYFDSRSSKNNSVTKREFLKGLRAMFPTTPIQIGDAAMLFDRLNRTKSRTLTFEQFARTGRRSSSRLLSVDSAASLPSPLASLMESSIPAFPPAGRLTADGIHAAIMNIAHPLSPSPPPIPAAAETRLPTSTQSCHTLCKFGMSPVEHSLMEEDSCTTDGYHYEPVDLAALRDAMIEYRVGHKLSTEGGGPEIDATDEETHFPPSSYRSHSATSASAGSSYSSDSSTAPPKRTAANRRRSQIDQTATAVPAEAAQESPPASAMTSQGREMASDRYVVRNENGAVVLWPPKGRTKGRVSQWVETGLLRDEDLRNSVIGALPPKRKLTAKTLRMRSILVDSSDHASSATTAAEDQHAPAPPKTAGPASPAAKSRRVSSVTPGYHIRFSQDQVMTGERPAGGRREPKGASKAGKPVQRRREHDGSATKKTTLGTLEALEEAIDTLAAATGLPNPWQDIEGLAHCVDRHPHPPGIDLPPLHELPDPEAAEGTGMKVSAAEQDSSTRRRSSQQSDARLVTAQRTLLPPMQALLPPHTASGDAQDVSMVKDMSLSVGAGSAPPTLSHFPSQEPLDAPRIQTAPTFAPEPKKRYDREEGIRLLYTSMKERRGRSPQNGSPRHRAPRMREGSQTGSRSRQESRSSSDGGRARERQSDRFDGQSVIGWHNIEKISAVQHEINRRVAHIEDMKIQAAHHLWHEMVESVGRGEEFPPTIGEGQREFKRYQGPSKQT
ncbi:unnamed protein product [Vitrella brassicaformis CCMP3155]|uniref:EF-hand domain-containing protein n=1 Tax=Vitrella brassicaformis (strain CCMP3155) TaxID=1169540 RepID=A0A0G4FPL9_VITBC|nr:unnamed protein product [Vitrella brassicaformis CCMP3155]|eukprot:CEM16402.1 unnamed protein product [Vitrella brassicaformis CCMP3155]